MDGGSCYQVLLEGTNVALATRRWFRRRRRCYGFYTTRFMFAAGDREAVTAAVSHAAADLRAQGFSPFAGEQFPMHASEVVEIDPEGYHGPGGGFSFYPEGT